MSYIPESTWKLLLGEVQHDKAHTRKHTEKTSKRAQHVLEDAKDTLANGTSSNGNGHVVDSETNDHHHKGPPVLVVDCLRVYPHTSHFG